LGITISDIYHNSTKRVTFTAKNNGKKEIKVIPITIDSHYRIGETVRMRGKGNSQSGLNDGDVLISLIAKDDPECSKFDV